MGYPRDMNPSPQPWPSEIVDVKFWPEHPAQPPDVTPEVTPNPIRQTLGLVTPEELAAALGVKEETLTVWRGAGTGPAHVKLGKRVFYRLQDLDFWVGTKFPETHAKPLPMQPLAGVDDADAETKVEVGPSELNPGSPWGKPVDAITAHERAMPPQTTGL